MGVTRLQFSRSTRSSRNSRSRSVYTVVVFVILASLDNAAIALYPVLTNSIASDLGTGETTVALVTTEVILITALTAMAWGYLGDQTRRKPILFWATLMWSAGLWAASGSDTVGELALWTVVVGVGLGAIASVGFSLISDFIPPERRGLAMSFWGLSQGVGGFLGILVGGVLGASDWRQPYIGLAVIGAAFAFLYLTTAEAPRGQSEPALTKVLEAGGSYDFKISRADLPKLLRIRTNPWLILQGLTAQLAYGSLIWVPLLYQSKVEADGYDVATATAVGAVFGAIFQLGGLSSIFAGHLGDRLQQRTARARAIVSAVGVLGAIPFFVVFFFIPLRGLEIPVGEGSMAIVVATLTSVITNPYAGAAFLLCLVAVILTSADSPNWFALISDVNLPEHRGTVFGIANLANGISRAAGNGLTVTVARVLAAGFAAPWNYAIGLALFQLFFVPTGFCYWRASRTCEADIAQVRSTLERRGRLALREIGGDEPEPPKRPDEP